MKRAITAFFAAFLLFLYASASAGSENLLSNGGFEEVVASGMPEGWFASAYRNQAGYSRMAATDEFAHTGRYSVVVENASSNDARFTCTAKVNPESLYKLSGYVLVENMEDTGNGANFGVEGIYSFSEGLFDTNGEWQYLEWYGETGEDQTEVTIGVRVGGYSAESTGKAYFDDIVLEEVDQLPEHVIASLWYNTYTGSSVDLKNESSSAGKNTLFFVLLGISFALIVYFVQILTNKTAKESCVHIVFALLLLIALILRICLATRVEGYQVDINCFQAWSLRMASVGPAGFYAPDYFCDYPPGAMLLLWPIGLLLNAIGLQNHGGVLLVIKLLPVLCDLLGAAVLYRVGRKHINALTSAAVAALYLFNPAALVNGAAWGQMDSVLALLVLLTTLCALKHDWWMAIPLFAVSALVKPQALLFAPVGGMALFLDFFSQNQKGRKSFLRQAATGFGIALVDALIIIIPFSVNQENPFTWLFDLYGKTLGSYAYATLNTANLYYLAGDNWTSLASNVPSVLFVVPVLLFAVFGFALQLKKVRVLSCRNKRKANALSVLSFAMAVALCLLWAFESDYSWYGYLMMVYAYLFALVCFAYEKKEGALPFYMALALIGVYVLGVKVHERYLFPALILMLMSYIRNRDHRLLWLFAGFSATTFINTAIVLENSILFGAEMGHLNQDTLLLNRLLCIANLMLCCFGGWIGVSGLQASKVQTAAATSNYANIDKKASYRRMLFQPQDHHLHLNWHDYLIVGITTALYAMLAFYNLGSTTAPQTAWVSTSDSESVVLELDESATFSVLYYAGVSYNDFAIAVSDDGENWSQAYPCEMREGLCYRWNYALRTSSNGTETIYPTSNPSNVLWLKGKYLRVDACDAGLNLWEIVARDEDGKTIPITIVAHTDARPQLLNESKPASHLIDEQDTCVGEPGWFNGTYFDEIYHARTAYEHLHGQAPYETTHPPLGKLMMSAAIAVFGMTPFGWRFAGALIGVLMLPAIYLLAMQLTHKRSVAVVSMLALTFDLMHFTQTRIATIDSFPVFFILLTYLFMVRYMQMDTFSVSDPANPKLLDKAYLKTLVPLLLCGICMGLSIASKWIGIYSAVGLAVLFFLTVYRQLRVNETAWALEENERVRVQAARTFTLPRIAITCGSCIIFFVLIPCAIYYLCYIPYLSPTGPVTLKRIIRAQEGMLSYHSTPGLGMDHPFQSPWWQWPFILKPMWFSQDQFEPAGYASTILCLGNPWIFYIGAIAMAMVLVCWIGKYIRIQNGRLAVQYGNGDMIYVILSIAFLAQYLPWVLVPRSMYMYHYFASVPFIILATAVLMERCTHKKPLLCKLVMTLYILGAIVFFVMFFPYASGYLTSTRWLDAMKWFSKLYY